MYKMLKNKTVLLGITGSIAAYKCVNLVRLLKKLHCDVHIIMTKNATHFINPITFETLSNNKCYIDTFDRNFQFQVQHISLAKKADLMLIAPASGNIIGKLAHGIADDMLTTTALATTCKKIIAPTMNTNMYNNPITQDNIKKLAHYDFTIIPPATGALANGDIGQGKMPSEDILLDYILAEIAWKKDMLGLKVLVTAGPTQEAIDPVRYITNHSSGKMGYAISKIAMLRGAIVTLISGETTLTPPSFTKVINIMNAQEMYDQVVACLPHQDIVIMSAAVSDYSPKKASIEKIKKSDFNTSLQLEPTLDILKHIGQIRKKSQYICGFSMETENMLEHARSKLIAKKLDMIVANNLKEKGAGFQLDTNIVTLITKEKEIQLELMPKEQIAGLLLTNILELR
jgi:phosphopantothenoylcysteine decarboxylase / phosphopantothenate---cysteine ligase